MSTTNVTVEIAEWIEKVRFDDIPRRITEEAKNQVLSMIAAVHAGYFSEVGRAIRRAAKDWNPGKEATIIPAGERVAIGDALFANCALAQALDYDDHLFAAHTGASAVLVTLALAEKIGFSGKEFLTAQIVANEIEGRLGAALLDCGQQSQSLAVGHLVGSAVIAAKIMGFERDKIASTLGLALAFPNASLEPAYFGSDAKALVAAASVANGVRAAQLVASGVVGPIDVLENPRGLLASFTHHPFHNAFSGLGTIWLTETLCYKPYPGCAAIDGALDCVLDLVRQHSIDSKKVKGVQVSTVPYVLETDNLIRPYLKGPDTLPSTLNFSVRYSVAAALVDRELSARQFTAERVRDPATWDLAERVVLSLDPAMTERARSAALVRNPGGSEGERVLELDQMRLNQYRPAVGAKVRIELHDGRSFEAEQEIPQGAAGKMFDDRRKVVQDKFRRETRYTLKKEKMEKAIDAILHIDQSNAAGLRELVRLCCSERN
ncbi:MAG TPA: MmgE/PrpD family protein [Terriglobales bacterium]|nr:MmgE/PrpD family protein [Terriglobales bacterium]